MAGIESALVLENGDLMGLNIRHYWRKLKLRLGSEETVNATLRAMGVRLGKNCRVYTVHFPPEPWLIRIGDNCAIGPDVTFVTHNANTIFQHKYDSLTGFGPIDIKENSYIGVNVTILPHVTIGPNSVVGAGSVVTKDVPPNVVAAGNPARVICTLDEYEVKCREQHIDVPKDREAMRKVLEERFWGDGA
jgi:acetyltransferase-like isoleucine patch superfamily enzyme